MGLLPHDEILRVYSAVVSARMVGSRNTLLAGLGNRFVAGLPRAESPGDQILDDLNAMNEAGALAEGRVPLATWLKNALALAAGKREQAVFGQVLARCERSLHPEARNDPGKLSPQVEVPSKTPGGKPAPPSAPPQPPMRKVDSLFPPGGENRICTVMIADLSDLAALSARLDPGEVKDLLVRCHRAIAEAIEALGGYPTSLGSTATVGVFGAYSASDSDAERAVYAALRLQTTLAKVRMPKAARSIRPSARVGISTGRLFVEMGSTALGSTRRLTVIGEPVIEAGSLQQTAAPGTIVIGRDTCQRVAYRFTVEPLSPVPVAGQDELLPAFRVVGPQTLQHSLSSKDFHGVDTSLVGRRAELSRVLDALETVCLEQRPAHLTLVGAPGMGRSRMLTEIFAATATQEQSYILSIGHAAALAAETSYGLAASLLRQRFRIREDAPPQEILHRLRVGVRWMRGRLTREAGFTSPPPTSNLLGGARDALPREDLDDALVQIAGFLDTHRTSPAVSSVLSSDDEGSRTKHRLAAAVACLVRFAASLSPVLILCDDVQWADDASLDLLDDLVVRLEGMPLLIVCTTRPDLYERRPHWSEGKATHRRIDLGPLERRHLEEMVRDRLRRVSALPPALVKILSERADGNPFILDETLRFLVDHGVIEVRGDGEPWKLHERDLRALPLPETVQGVVQARLDRLDRLTRAALERAAVVGKTFWEDLLDELRRATPLLTRSTADIVAVLRERKLVLVHEATTFEGQRELVFAESTTQQVAHEMLPMKVRRSLHLRVAEWLERRAPSATRTALLAQHYDLGGAAPAAIEAYRQAAAHASSLGENTDALNYLSRACEIDDERDEEAEGDEIPGVPWPDRVHLRLDLGNELRRLGRLDEAEAAYEKAAGFIPATEPEAPRWRARVAFRLALSFQQRGEITRAREIVERAIAEAKESGMLRELPAMYVQLTFLQVRERNHDPAARWRTCLEGLRICRAIRSTGERSLEAETRALLGLARAQAWRKRWIAAERTFRQAARLAAQAGDFDLLGRALNGVAAMLNARGDQPRARAMFLESLRAKEKAGDLHQLAVAYSNVAEVEIAMKEYAAALEHARRAVRTGEQARADSDLAEMYRNVAEAALGLGKVEAAMDACLHALEIAARAGRNYLDNVMETLARICARAAEAEPGGAPLRARAIEIRGALTALVEQSFVEAPLRQRIRDLMSFIEPFLSG